MTVDGPAAGHDRLKTNADPTGASVLGTLNNCAGGQTPWGTYLTAEENFHGYFWTDRKAADGKRAQQGPRRRPAEELRALRRARPTGTAGASSTTASTSTRKPNEPNRFGWIVEIDPFDPQLDAGEAHGARPLPARRRRDDRQQGRPRGRLFAATIRASSMSTASSPTDRYQAGRQGRTTCACCRKARCRSRASTTTARVTWLPLVFGEGPLTPANGFNSQADVLIDARLAADLLKATPMDRPEDVQPHPTNGKVYRHADQQRGPAAGPSRSTRPIRGPRTSSATSSR